MSDVLVLNASYEPLHRESWEDAITKVVKGKAVIEEFIEGKIIRSKTMQFPWPLVIRLVKYVKVPVIYGEQPWSKAGVMKRDNYVCVFCGKHADTVEHLQPQSRFPELSRDWMNTVAACFPCNNKKGNRTLKEAHMTLRFEPTIPVGFRRLRGGS